MAIVKEIKITSNMDEAAKDADKLAGSLGKVAKEGDKTKKSIEEVSSNGGAIAILDSLTGGLATRMRDAFEATKLFNGSLKATRGALLATGIGAFVVALGLVVAYWDDIVELVNQTNKKLEYQSTILENQRVQIDHKLKINQQLVELAEIEGRSKDKLLGLERDLLVEKRKNLEDSIKILEAQLAIEESKIREVTLFEKGLIGLKAYVLGYGTVASSVTNALGLDVIAEAQGKLDKLKEELGAIDIAIARIDNPKTDATSKKTGTEKDTSKIGFDDSVQKRIDDEIKAIEEIARIRQEFADKNREDELAQSELDRERKIMEIEQLVADEVFKREAIAEVNKFYDEQAAEIEQKRIDDKLEAEKKAAEETKKIRDEAIQHQIDGINSVKNLTSNVFEILDNIGSADEKKKESRARKQFGVQKALNLGLAAIDGFKAITSSLSQSPIAIGPIPNPAGIASLAFAGVTSALNIAKIATAKFKGGGSSSGGGGSAGDGGAPAIPKAPAFNLIEGTGSNQIADSIQGGQKPIKAFVVSSDVSSSQEMDRNIESNATL